jgi:hypothetical protein
MSSGRDDMMEKWSDEFQEQRLQDLAGDVDGFLTELVHTYKLPVLSALSIVLARLVVASKQFGAEQEFRMIIDMANTAITEKDEKVVH